MISFFVHKSGLHRRHLTCAGVGLLQRVTSKVGLILKAVNQSPMSNIGATHTHSVE